MKTKPRLLIISPTWSQGWWGGGKVLSPPLILPLLAGLTPADFDVQLIDENVEPIDLNAPADAVAITCMTASAPRAYAIADSFRRRHIPVIIGGIHPTVLPDEAARHADAVVIGEAEPRWRALLADLAAGRLQSRYQHPGFADLSNLPIPRRHLLRADKYLTINVVQTSRGCPNGCTFCTVSSVFGRNRRYRPVEHIVEELRTLGGWVGFVDDNITAPPARAKQLFEALIPLKIRWVGQGDLGMARDPELLSLAARSGCKAMFIGLESLSTANLKSTAKAPNLGVDMGEAIAKIHKAGIEIIGSFIFGLDDDTPEVFAKTVAFAQNHKLVAAQFSMLTPFPGTNIHNQLRQQDRITDFDWSHYTMSNVLFRPARMSAAQLAEGQRYSYRRFYSIPSILRRSFTTRRNYTLRLLVNFSYRGIARGKGIHKHAPAHRPAKLHTH